MTVRLVRGGVGRHGGGRGDREDSNATGVNGNQSEQQRHRLPARRTCSCAAARPGRSRPTSKPPTPGRMTSSAMSVAVSGDTVVVGALRGGQQRDRRERQPERTTAPPMPARRTCSCAAARPGRSRPTSKPPTPERMTTSAGPWRWRATRWWSGRIGRTAAPPG